jgi:uncharacterized membrane protein
MNFERLMWIFAGLFVVFGLLLGVSDDPTTRNIWGGLSAGFLGGFALAMAADGMQQGRIRFGFDVIHRAVRPRLFVLATAVVVLAGVVTLAAAFWISVFEPIAAVALMHERSPTNTYS